jgi:hypothetical protein
MSQVEYCRRTPSFLGYAACAAAFSLCWVPSSQAQLLLQPGAQATIAIDSVASDCTTDESVAGTKFAGSPITACLDDPGAETQLEVFAASAFSSQFQLFTGTFSSIQNHSATARLISEVEVETPSEEPYSSTLKMQVATEAAWSGGFIAAGAPSTFGQVTATLQLRDVTDATESDPGPVIASDTFFVERFDSTFDLEVGSVSSSLVDLLNQVDAIDVSNSSGADLTAWVRRGRTYQIELEVKCDVGAPAFGFAICMFSGASAADELQLSSTNPLAVVLANDGFRIAPIEVRVDSDPVQDTASQL